MNKIVARFADGRTLKGSTADFVPTKDHFHITVVDAPAGSSPVQVRLKDLKALFFVKDIVGDSTRKDRTEFDPSRPLVGRKIKVLFKDGEVMVGTTLGYQPGRSGFFLIPADPESNMERCYVVTSATDKVTFI